MSLVECPECGRKKKYGQAYKNLYQCRKCGQRGCVSLASNLARITSESCWPTDDHCPAGGTHDRVRINLIFAQRLFRHQDTQSLST